MYVSLPQNSSAWCTWLFLPQAGLNVHKWLAQSDQMSCRAEQISEQAFLSSSLAIWHNGSGISCPVPLLLCHERVNLHSAMRRPNSLKGGGRNGKVKDRWLEERSRSLLWNCWKSSGFPTCSTLEQSWCHPQSICLLCTSQVWMYCGWLDQFDFSAPTHHPMQKKSTYWTQVMSMDSRTAS